MENNISQRLFEALQRNTEAQERSYEQYQRLIETVSENSHVTSGLVDSVSDLSTRMMKIELLQAERERLSIERKENRDFWTGVFRWLIATGIAAWGVIVSFKAYLLNLRSH